MYDITKLERGEVSYKQTGILLDPTTAQSDEMDSSEAFPVQVLTCQGISQKSTKMVLRELNDFYCVSVSRGQSPYRTQEYTDF